jgi:hypothetical protein
MVEERTIVRDRSVDGDSIRYRVRLRRRDLGPIEKGAIVRIRQDEDQS